jgi:hypothetical protein
MSKIIGLNISRTVIDGCQNLEASYGEICVECNKCGRYNGRDLKKEKSELIELLEKLDNNEKL